jgi:hypothetical protein
MGRGPFFSFLPENLSGKMWENEQKIGPWLPYTTLPKCKESSNNSFA